MEAEARYGPFRVGTPWLCEGTDASRTMRLWLQEHPPESGKVACRMAGRGVVIAAGLQPLSLPSSWEE